MKIITKLSTLISKYQTVVDNCWIDAPVFMFKLEDVFVFPTVRTTVIKWFDDIEITIRVLIIVFNIDDNREINRSYQ